MFKSGFVSIVGEPNVGKSTLINVLLNKKISIVSHKPQTTRNRILGILHRENAQIIFMDTPGFFRPKRKIDKKMVSTAEKAIKEGEIVLFLTDATLRPEQIKNSFDFIKTGPEVPVFLLLNKIDLLPKDKLLPLIESLSSLSSLQHIIPISALKKENLDSLEKAITSCLPEGHRYFPEDMDTDQPENFLIAEIIREKVFHFTHKEIPYASFVAVENIEEKKGVLCIDANIFVEKESQKPIVIGKNGFMMKTIGKHARKELETIFKTKVYLGLWVKVRKGWRCDDIRLNRLIY